MTTRTDDKGMAAAMAEVAGAGQWLADMVRRAVEADRRERAPADEVRAVFAKIDEALRNVVKDLNAQASEAGDRRDGRALDEAEYRAAGVEEARGVVSMAVSAWAARR